MNQNRCKTCGTLNDLKFLNSDRVCEGCVLQTKLNLFGRFNSNDEQEKFIEEEKKQEELIKVPKSFDHPDLLKPKGLSY